MSQDEGLRYGLFRPHDPGERRAISRRVACIRLAILNRANDGDPCNEHMTPSDFGIMCFAPYAALPQEFGLSYAEAGRAPQALIAARKPHSALIRSSRASFRASVAASTSAVHSPLGAA